MKQERPHEQGAAHSKFADSFSGSLADYGDPCLGYSPQSMRAGNDSQCAVGFVAWVEVQPN